jgi:carbonic anhydrase
MSSFPEALTDRYRRFKHRHFVPNADHYEELATYGQSPDTMVISCSDSRVDPETIFSAMPGELFILRNIANLVPPFETGGNYHGVSAAIEFGVLNLRVKHLIVLGHSGCGGVKASIKARPFKRKRNSFRDGCPCSTRPGWPFSQTTKTTRRRRNTLHWRWNA